MTSLHSLPEHLVGVLFSLLPDPASKEAFFSCCRTVYDAPSVLDQVCKLVVPHRQVLASNEAPICPPMYFPRAAQLSELAFKGSVPWSRTGGEVMDDSSLILKLLLSWDEGAHAKLQQVTRITLHNCCFCPNKEAASLGAFLHSLPRLQSLAIPRRGGPEFATTNLTAFLHSLSPVLPSAGGAGVRLKELYCDVFDGPSLQAVSCLSSFDSLSMSSLEDTTVDELRLLSSLTAVRQLTIKNLQPCHQQGLKLALPRLQRLTLLKMEWLGSPITNMPQFLRSLDLRNARPQNLCSYLESIVRGTCSSSFCQLHIFSLFFMRADFVNHRYLDSVPALHELGRCTAAHLAVLPSLSPSFVFAVNCAWIPPSISPFLAFIEQVLQLAHGLSSIVIGKDFDVLHSQTVAKQCPNITELCPNGVIQFDDLQASLKEVLNGFPHLSHFVFVVDIMDEPDYARICAEFCVALALDRQTRGSEVSLIDVGIFLNEGDLCFPDDADDEIDSVVHGHPLEPFADSLEQAWDHINALVLGKTC